MNSKMWGEQLRHKVVTTTSLGFEPMKLILCSLFELKVNGFVTLHKSRAKGVESLALPPNPFKSKPI